MVKATEGVSVKAGVKIWELVGQILSTSEYPHFSHILCCGAACQLVSCIMLLVMSISDHTFKKHIKSEKQDFDFMYMGLHQCISADFNEVAPDLHQ